MDLEAKRARTQLKLTLWRPAREVAPQLPNPVLKQLAPIIHNVGKQLFTTPEGRDLFPLFDNSHRGITSEDIQTVINTYPLLKGVVNSPKNPIDKGDVAEALGFVRYIGDDYGLQDTLHVLPRKTPNGTVIPDEYRVQISSISLGDRQKMTRRNLKFTERVFAQTLGYSMEVPNSKILVTLQKLNSILAKTQGQVLIHMKQVDEKHSFVVESPLIENKTTAGILTVSALLLLSVPFKASQYRPRFLVVYAVCRDFTRASKSIIRYKAEKIERQLKRGKAVQREALTHPFQGGLTSGR